MVLEEEIKKILKSAKIIAVVGLSDNTERPSYEVASYLMDYRYEIIPVNPMIREWKGIRSYQSLLEVPGKIDVVDIFRKSEDVLPIVEQAIKIKAKVVWMQLGVVNEEAAKKARKTGLKVVLDKCMKIEHQCM